MTEQRILSSGCVHKKKLAMPDIEIDLEFICHMTINSTVYKLPFQTMGDPHEK
ncbi:hypothetical protein [Virgibacillus sp. CBA3643]|uniref:hypothetical protein n=1 Tax=Virgibacillus sp. CBA3643 TaxID=2942278 RepID=UPI0035A26CA3